MEVAILFRTPDGRYVHRREMHGSDLKSDLGAPILSIPTPRRSPTPVSHPFPRAVEDHSLSMRQALEAALAQDPLAHGKWVASVEPRPRA